MESVAQVRRIIVQILLKFFALLLILHYSLAILNTNDNALSLLFFANAPMSDTDTMITTY